MYPQLKKIILSALSALPLFLLQSPQAQEPSGGGGVLVLPFKIEASLTDTKAFLSSKYPALDLQKASHFLIEQHYEYPLVPISETQSILDELEFKAHSLLDLKRARRICQRSTADYLLTGNSYAASKQSLLLQILSFNCRTHKLINSPKVKINSRIAIQSKLRESLKRVLPFARARPLLLSPSIPSQRALDLAVILDFSGSMRQDLPEILGQLRHIKRNYPVESRLGAITMEDQNRVEALKMNRNWHLNLKILSRKKKRGEVTFPGLLKALAVAERYENWENKAMLLFFTDLALSSRQAARLFTPLQSLRARGLQFCFFPLSRTKQAKPSRLAQTWAKPKGKVHE